jgi:hypothetical protein
MPFMGAVETPFLKRPHDDKESGDRNANDSNTVDAKILVAGDVLTEFILVRPLSKQSIKDLFRCKLLLC